MIMKQNPKRIGRTDISDLNDDPVVVWQHRHYIKVVIFMGLIFPCLVTGIGWGDWKGVWTGPADKQAFKEFWSKSARDIEDLGEYIRENVDEWINQRKARAKQEENRERTTAPIDPEKTKPQ